MKVGLLFGSFNPIHIGHLIVADSMLELLDLERVWLVVSPQNPFKSKTELAPEEDRLAMVRHAVADHPSLAACDVELGLPRPSYTVRTLQTLAGDFPKNDFALIMGRDNLGGFWNWKAPRQILDLVPVHVYDRVSDPGEKGPEPDHPRITLHELPLVDASATRIRERIAGGRSIRYWVLPAVEAYIRSRQLYASPGD